MSQDVQLLHVILGHAPIERMVEVVENGFFKNLPPELTVKAIRKYFPFACFACLKGCAQKEAASAKLVLRADRGERKAIRRAEAGERQRQAYRAGQTR